MTSLPHSPARPALLLALIAIALVLRAQADDTSHSALSLVGGLPADRPVLSLDGVARPCPLWLNRSCNGLSNGCATDHPNSKDTQ